MLEFAIAAEELARVDVNVPTTLLATASACSRSSSSAPRSRTSAFCGRSVNAEGSLLASFAFTDVAGGANYDSEDPGAGIQTIARIEGDRIINGEKHYTTNGTGWDGKGAHLFTVVCRTDPDAGASESLTVVAVPGDTPGSRWWRCTTRSAIGAS